MITIMMPQCGQTQPKTNMVSWQAMLALCSSDTESDASDVIAPD